MKLLKYILILALAFSGSLLAADSLFVEANKLYEAQQYEEAILRYESMLQENPFTAELNYNLANAYYQSDQLGKSILHYEKALKLDPGNKDVKQNLQLAYLKSENSIEPLPQLFFLEWWQQILARNTASVWGKWAVFFAWVSMVLFGIAYWKKRAKLRLGAWLTLVFCVSAALFAYQKNKQDTISQFAIVMSEEVSLKETPNINSTEVVTAYEGLKVELIDSVDDWTKVKLEDETEAWLQSSSIASI